MTQMLEGGRPVMAVNKDCCYKDAEGKVYILQNEICTLETDKANLESQLKGIYLLKYKVEDGNKAP